MPQQNPKTMLKIIICTFKTNSKKLRELGNCVPLYSHPLWAHSSIPSTISPEGMYALAGSSLGALNRFWLALSITHSSELTGTETSGCHFLPLLSTAVFYHSKVDRQETARWLAWFSDTDYHLHIQIHNHLLHPEKNRESQVISSRAAKIINNDQ